MFNCILSGVHLDRNLPIQMERGNFSIMPFVVGEVKVIGQCLLFAWESENKSIAQVENDPITRPIMLIYWHLPHRFEQRFDVVGILDDQFQLCAALFLDCGSVSVV